jgi:hypothetical protein
MENYSTVKRLSWLLWQFIYSWRRMTSNVCLFVFFFVESRGWITVICLKREIQKKFQFLFFSTATHAGLIQRQNNSANRISIETSPWNIKSKDEKARFHQLNEFCLTSAYEHLMWFRGKDLLTNRNANTIPLSF